MTLVDDIECVSLSGITEEQLTGLMTNDLVAAQMPLLAGGFSAKKCRALLAAKKQLWDDHGYGPWAFLIKGEFAGWGGLQPEQGDADFALVLHPKFWGWGRRIFNRVKDQAFGHMNLESITILLPPSRPNAKAVQRLGFVDDGALSIDGELFLRFRLNKPGKHR